jgi:hypothetical protein
MRGGATTAYAAIGGRSDPGPVILATFIPQLASLVDIDTIDATGLGTLLLALGTFALAWFTRRAIAAADKERQIAERALEASIRQGEIAQVQADIAQQTLKAQDQPLLIDLIPDAEPPYGIAREVREFVIHTPAIDFVHRFSAGPGDVYIAWERGFFFCRVPLRNAGRGLARLMRRGIELHGDGVEETVWQKCRARVPEREAFDVLVMASGDCPGGVPPEQFRLGIPYTVTNDRAIRLVTVVIERAESNWVVADIEFLEQS